MRGLNKVQLIGNLGKDPETIVLEGNVSVSKLTIATTETYKDKEGKAHHQTEWHNVVLWRGLANISQKYLTKGSLVYIEGKLRTRHYQDKEGNKKYVTEVVADEFIMLDKKSES